MKQLVIIRKNSQTASNTVTILFHVVCHPYFDLSEERFNFPYHELHARDRIFGAIVSTYPFKKGKTKYNTIQNKSMKVKYNTVFLNVLLKMIKYQFL